MKLISVRWNEILLISPGFCRLFQKAFRTSRLPRAIVIWPFLVVRNEEEFNRPWVINHERIHIRQNTDLLVAFMVLLQYAEVLYARLILRLTREESYYFQSAEQEAYLNQHNLNYLQNRPYLAQLKYLRHKKRFRVNPAIPGDLIFY